MEQVIFGGHIASLDVTNTKYNNLISHTDYYTNWTATIFLAEVIVSTGGKIKNLRVKLDDSPGADTHYDFTLMVNGAPSALTLEIADAATSGADTTHEVDVVAGDTICLRCEPTDTPTARKAFWTSMFEGATAKESLILGSSCIVVTSKTDIIYGGVNGGAIGAGTLENDARQVCPTSGKIKNLYVELELDPGTSPDRYRFTLRKNGADTDLEVLITANATTGHDTVDEIAVVAGDVLTLKIAPENTPEVSTHFHIGMTFVADIDGESIIPAGSTRDLHNTDTKYNNIVTVWGDSWFATESVRYMLGQSCILKKLYVLLSAAPGDGKSYTFTLRKPGNGQADGNVTVQIADTDTTGNSGALEDAIADDDYVDLECTPAGTPTVRDAYWGLVSYRAPPVGLENKSANMGSKMVAAGLI